ncbi:MAG: hypothetical protein HY706_11485 [Candidatus Hydrogenedentes bacterium]|nr:hypothetical protein [Candidatus Hydrogenedentota bacterium]
MRNAVRLLGLVFAALTGYSEEQVAVPWSEIKALYRESLEREILEESGPLLKPPQVYSIDEARYTLAVGDEHTKGEVTLIGKVVSGTLEPIPLFGDDIVITDVTGVSGGTILSSRDDNRMSFLAHTTGSDFQVTMGFVVRPREANNAHVISFEIPHALRNSLDLKLSAQDRLVEAPGVIVASGVRHFPRCSNLCVKYLDPRDMATATVIEIDIFSRIVVLKNRILIATHLLPVRSIPGPVVLRAPEGAKYVASSLGASAIKELGEDRYELNVPPGEKDPFTFDLALEAATDDGGIAFLLPTLEANTGQQGRFVVEEPDDGQVTVTAPGLTSQIPAERLAEALRKETYDPYFMTVEGGEEIALAIKRFQSVRTPTTVLESQYLYCAFEESGNILSILVLEAPPELGTRLVLKAVSGSEIWSLTVNGEKKKVFAGAEETWIIPLEDAQVSYVELAFLRKGPKLGLQGTLEAMVPETGIPSQNLRIGVALPERVELLSLEGPVSATSGDGWKLPAEFVGKPYFFSRSFHKGEGMTLGIVYKEPVNHAESKEGMAQ